MSSCRLSVAGPAYASPMRDTRSVVELQAEIKRAAAIQTPLKRAMKEIGTPDRTSWEVLSACGSAGPQHVLHLTFQLLHRKRFDEQGVTLLDDIALDDLSVVVSGHEQHFDVGLEGGDFIGNHRTAHAWRDDVGQEQFDPRIIPEKPNRALAAVGSYDMMAASG